MSLDTYTQNIPLTQKARCVKIFLISASELPHTKELLTLLIAGSGPTTLPPSRVRSYSCCTIHHRPPSSRPFWNPQHPLPQLFVGRSVETGWSHPIYILHICTLFSIDRKWVIPVKNALLMVDFKNFHLFYSNRKGAVPICRTLRDKFPKDTPQPLLVIFFDTLLILTPAPFRYSWCWVQTRRSSRENQFPPHEWHNSVRHPLSYVATNQY